MNYRPAGFSVLPMVVKNLLIINVLFYLGTIALMNMGINLYDVLGLHYFKSDLFNPIQIVTSMFMHGSFQHIFFNMFAVWMFGSAIENYWGPKRFLQYYILTGIGAAALHYLIIHFQVMSIESQLTAEAIEIVRTEGYGVLQQGKNYVEPSWRQLNLLYNSNLVGASGALFGILLAFGMLFPNTEIFFIFFPIPIKAKYFVMGYGALELFLGLSNNPGDNVAHFAHLGGMLFGYLMIKFWRKRGIY